LNSLELYNLKQFCRKHELDIQLIDNSLTYSENLDRLNQHRISDVEELADAYASTYEELSELLTQGDKMGIPDEYLASSNAVRMIKLKAVMRYKFRHGKTVVKSRRKIAEIIEGYVNPCLKCPFHKTCEHRLKVEITRERIKVYGIASGVAKIQYSLMTHGIYYKTVRLMMRTKGLEYIEGKGWVQKLSA